MVQQQDKKQQSGRKFTKVQKSKIRLIVDIHKTSCFVLRYRTAIAQFAIVYEPVHTFNTFILVHFVHTVNSIVCDGVNGIYLRLFVLQNE